MVVTRLMLTLLPTTTTNMLSRMTTPESISMLRSTVMATTPRDPSMLSFLVMEATRTRTTLLDKAMAMATDTIKPLIALCPRITYLSLSYCQMRNPRMNLFK